MKRFLFTFLRKIARTFGGGDLTRLNALAKLPVIKHVYNFIFSRLKPESVMVQGHIMYLDERDTLHLAQSDNYEPSVTRLFKSHIKEGMTVLDIGANIGYYTLLAAKLVGKSGKVYAFEPDPKMYELLKKNVISNAYSNVTIVKKAVGNKTKKVKFYEAEYNKGDNSLINVEGNRPFTLVQMTTLDEELKNVKADFIKIDIQGAEMLALLGMKTLLQKSPRVKMVSEFEPRSITSFGFTPKEYLQALIDLGFQIKNVNETGVRVMSHSNLITRYKDTHTDIFCEKK